MKLNNYIQHLITAALLLLATGSVYAEQAGNVIRATGVVNAVDSTGKTRALSAGDVINVGDTVVAGSKSTSSLQMKDSAVIAMTSDSAVKFLEYRVNAGAGKPDKVDIDFQKGRARIMTGHADKKGYTLRMPGAVVKPTGTGIDFTITDGKSSAILRSGSIEVTDTTGKSTTIDVAGLEVAVDYVNGGNTLYSGASKDDSGDLVAIAAFQPDGNVTVLLGDGSTLVINPATGLTETLAPGAVYVSGSFGGSSGYSPGVGGSNSGMNSGSTNNASP